GDPEKCDNFGNTALHWAAQNGHIECVSFLISFGVNLWSLDNDYHTAKEIAALNNRDEIVQLIDHVIAQQSAFNTKTEKARQEAEKRIKLFRKLQQKTIRQAEKDERKREKNLMKKNLCLINTTMAGSTTIIDNDEQTDELFNIYDTLDLAAKNGSTAAINLSQHSCGNSGGNHSNVVPKYSDLVNGTMKTSKMPKILSTVSRKVLTRKHNSTDTIKSNSTCSTGRIYGTDGTCRSIQSMMVGIRRDDHIVYVPKFNSLSVNDLIAAAARKTKEENSDDCCTRLSLKNVFDEKQSSTIQRLSTTNKSTNTFNRNNIKTTLKNKLFKLNK
ncbi:Ankyrin repeat and SAM domain-containing protein, partial [Euroglyphus maynei]